MSIKDAADLFAAEGERAKDVLEGLKQEAQDALELALSEAPEGSQRDRYRYARERVFSLLLGIDDVGERGAALDDVASRLRLRKPDLREAFAEFEERVRQDQETAERAEEQTQENLAPEPGTERHERAMELITNPDILGRVVRDTERLGHVGETTAKKLAFVCAISASAGHPIQPSTHADSSTGKNFLWDTVLLLFPQDMVLRRSAMSEKALFFTEEDLRGKIIYMQEVAGSEGADFTIRVLQSAQYLEYEVTEKTPEGTFRAVTYTKEGPVVVVQTTTQIRLYHENDTRVFPIYLDESAEQTQRIVDSALLTAETGGISAEERELILEVWRDAIPMLEPAQVIIPYARRIEVPSHQVRVRRDVNRILDVIRVLAWLHQHGRERDEEGRILAVEEDFYLALDLVSDSLKRAWESLTPAEEAVMEAIQALPEANRRNGFTRNDLEIEGYHARRAQDALKALTETGYLEREGRRGPGGYRYTVSRDPENNVLGISLRTEGDERGEDGEGGPEGPGAEDGEDEGRESRAIARIEDRAIESPLSSDKDPNALLRGEEEGDYFADGEDSEEEEDVDYLHELTELGWYRAETLFPAEGPSEGDPLWGDPVARSLRHEIPIYKGRNWWSDVYGESTPWAITAESLLEMGPESETEDSLYTSSPWPATPEEMSARLWRIVPLLQAKAHPFWDPGYSDWFARMRLDHPQDLEKSCKDAYLHAELWRNEETSEEIWVFVALTEGWRIPDEEIEEAVWWRATYDPNAVVKIDPSDDDDDFQF